MNFDGRVRKNWTKLSADEVKNLKETYRAGGRRMACERAVVKQGVLHWQDVQEL